MKTARPNALQIYNNLRLHAGRGEPQSYFECGPVTPQVLDVSSQRQPRPAAKALYFTVNDLEAVYERAKAPHCLSDSDIHDAAGGGIVVRPWGERSFYVQDSWGSPLCFMEEGTVYTGRGSWTAAKTGRFGISPRTRGLKSSSEELRRLTRGCTLIKQRLTGLRLHHLLQRQPTMDHERRALQLQQLLFPELRKRARYRLIREVLAGFEAGADLNSI